jgi:hypothetical protein
MSHFLRDSSYHIATTYAACIEFHLDEHRRRGFNSSQLIAFSLDPNPDAGDDKNQPPQKLSLTFSTADVVVLGWRLGLVVDYLRDNRLSAVGILPKRYVELERTAAFISAIVITPVGKE